jgi:hypothetical protein
MPLTARFWRIFTMSFLLALAGSAMLVAGAQADTPPGIMPASASTTSPPQPGDTLSETAALWSAGSPSSTSIQWLQCDPSGANCGPISGATSSSYRVQPGDVGFTIAVQETDNDAPGGTQQSGPTLVVAPNSTNTDLLTAPTRAMTNQAVTLVATITSSSGFTPPGGSMTFTDGSTPIAGCASLPVTTAKQSANVTCQTTFSAGASPAHLTAVFTASAGSGNAGSASSPPVDLSVGRDGSSTSLDLANPTVAVGSSATYTATVAASDSGPFQPSGSVEFRDNGKPIPSCASRPLAPSQSTVTAQCTVPYPKSARHKITAQYLGDRNFLGSASRTVNVNVHGLPLAVKGIIKSSTRWVFRFTPSYTRILSFVIHRALPGMTVALGCRGSGCPFARWSAAVNKTGRCLAIRALPCAPLRHQSADLSSRLRGYYLRPGSAITVRLTRPHWIGKQYRFSIRAAQAPNVQILCVAPGAKRAGVGC